MSLKIAPQSPETLNNRSFSYHSKSLYDKAISDFDKAVKIWLGYTKTYFNRVFSYGKKGQA